ncbi:MAG: uroporphyrinogen decarboxylase family protein [Spirochaetota bacterium]
MIKRKKPGQEKLLKALNHEETQVPIDFGSTAVTGIHVSIVAGLKDYYGLEKEPVKVHEPYQMLGLIEEDLKNAIGIDIEGVFSRNTMFGFPITNWKEWRTPWEQVVLVPGNFNTTTAANGDILLYPEGDTSVPPCAKMPASGKFFDSIIRQEPIDDDKLDPEDNLEDFKPIKKEDLQHFSQGVKTALKTDRGIIVTFGGTAIGDIALVPAPFLKHPKGIRDVAEWYISIVARQDYLHKIFAPQTEIAIENLKKIYKKIGNSIDAVFICGTDFGTQTSTFCSTETFDTLYAPYYKRINGWIHENTAWKTFKHSCGAVEVLMPHFIESGFDIINPVQCSATGMEPAKLKEKYGPHLTFWGGGVDTQKTLPFGTPDEVRKEVLERLSIFSKNGGYVFNSIHNVQANTPIKNVVAMIEAVHKFNGE